MTSHLKVGPVTKPTTDSLRVCEEVFGSNPKLSVKTTRIVAGYLHPQIEYAYNYRYFQERVDLAKRETLKPLLAKEFRKGEVFEDALSVAQGIYEVAPRNIPNARVGAAVTAEAEVLRFLMQLAPGKVFLEIAGARGEHAILLAFAGAARVILNDKTHSETEQFLQMRAAMPASLQKRLELAEGDCRQVLQTPPWGKTKIDLALCRNLIHIQPDEENEQLLSGLIKTLAEGARMVFVVNSIYALRYRFPVFDSDPQATCFLYKRCMFVEPNKPEATFYSEFTPCSSNLVRTPLKAFTLYEKNPGTKNKWVFNENEFDAYRDACSTKFAQSALEAMETCRPVLEGLPHAAIQARVSVARFYTEANLTELLESRGLEVECTFLVDQQGHLLPYGEDPFLRGQQVGIIAKKKG